MKFLLPSPREAIDTLAVFEGFSRVPGRKWVYIHPDKSEDRLIAFEELPRYFTDLRAMFSIESKIYKGPLWYHYCRVLHLLCKSEGDASVHATAQQRATAFITILNAPEQDWPSILLSHDLQSEPDGIELTETLQGLLEFTGMSPDSATEAIQKMTTVNPLSRVEIESENSRQ